MCRTVHAVLQTAICGIQMLVRVFMTVILMLENLIRMILQTLYNFISFMLQMISLIPICVVFLLTARLKCFMCGGGGPCPVNRGGTCDCLMSAMAILILFFILRAFGLLDVIFYKIGYVKAYPIIYTRYVPTPGEMTECSRNWTDYVMTTTPTTTTIKPSRKKKKWWKPFWRSGQMKKWWLMNLTLPDYDTIITPLNSVSDSTPFNWTTVVYYLV